MNGNLMQLFWSFSLGIIIIFAIGIYCIYVTYNLVRILIGVEVLIKAATLLIIVAGYTSGHEALAQSMVITLIVIEVVVITVAVGVMLGIRSVNNSLDVRKIKNLRG